MYTVKTQIPDRDGEIGITIRVSDQYVAGISHTGDPLEKLASEAVDIINRVAIGIPCLKDGNVVDVLTNGIRLARNPV